MKFLKIGASLINVDRIEQVDLEWKIVLTDEESEIGVRISYISGKAVFFSGEQADQVRHFFRTLMR